MGSGRSRTRRAWFSQTRERNRMTKIGHGGDLGSPSSCVQLSSDSLQREQPSPAGGLGCLRPGRGRGRPAGPSASGRPCLPDVEGVGRPLARAAGENGGAWRAPPPLLATERTLGSARPPGLLGSSLLAGERVRELPAPSRHPWRLGRVTTCIPRPHQLLSLLQPVTTCPACRTRGVGAVGKGQNNREPSQQGLRGARGRRAPRPGCRWGATTWGPGAGARGPLPATEEAIASQWCRWHLRGPTRDPRGGWPGAEPHTDFPGVAGDPGSHGRCTDHFRDSSHVNTMVCAAAAFLHCTRGPARHPPLCLPGFLQAGEGGVPGHQFGSRGACTAPVH